MLFRIDLANLPIEIPPELLATGGTITIQKRKVSVTKTAEPHAIHSTTNNNDTHTTTTNILTQPPQQQSTTSERRSSKVYERIF